MTCREFAELLDDFVSGDLPADKRQLADGHLQECPPCIVFLNTYQLTILISRKLPSIPLPAALEGRLRTAIQQQLAQ